MIMKSSKFSIIQVLAVIDCSILLKSHYIIQLLRYVIHAMRNLFEVRTMAAILIFTTHAIDACGISYETGFNCVVHAFFWELMCGRCCKCPTSSKITIWFCKFYHAHTRDSLYDAKESCEQSQLFFSKSCHGR